MLNISRHLLEMFRVILNPLFPLNPHFLPALVLGQPGMPQRQGILLKLVLQLRLPT